MKTFVCPIGVDQADEDLTVAADLCQQAGAHLSVLVLALAPPPPVGEHAAVAAEAWLDVRRLDLDHLNARVELVERLVSGLQLSADVIGEYQHAAFADQVIGRRARYGDLTLVGPSLLASADLKPAVLEGALFASGRPVLLMPEGSRPTLRPKRVAVAWDSRLESSVAVKDSLDVLRTADDVRLVLVDPIEGVDAQGAEPGADAAAYLARHGVKVTVDRIPSLGRPVADALNGHAVDCAAELLVMGAYGHSRLRERVFGGVTRSMIENPALPIFMSH